MVEDIHHGLMALCIAPGNHLCQQSPQTFSVSGVTEVGCPSWGTRARQPAHPLPKHTPLFHAHGDRTRRERQRRRTRTRTSRRSTLITILTPIHCSSSCSSCRVTSTPTTTPRCSRGQAFSPTVIASLLFVCSSCLSYQCFLCTSFKEIFRSFFGLVVVIVKARTRTATSSSRTIAC